MLAWYRFRRDVHAWTVITGFWTLLSAPASGLAGASTASRQKPVLELEQMRTHRVPPGVTVGGAVLSREGDRLLAWSARAPTVLLYDGSDAEPRTLPAFRPVVGGRFLGRSTGEMVHSDGTMSHMAWAAPPTKRVESPASAEVHSAVRGPGGWWFLAPSSSSDGTELHFVPDGNGGMSRSTFVAPLWPSTDRIFLAVAEADALVAFRDPPHTVWRIAMR